MGVYSAQLHCVYICISIHDCNIMAHMLIINLIQASEQQLSVLCDVISHCGVSVGWLYAL